MLRPTRARSALLTTADVFDDPQDPYTADLVGAIPGTTRHPLERSTR